MIKIPDDPILQGKYPAKAHCRRVAEWIREKAPDVARGVLYLEGRATRYMEDNDQEEHFRQRRYFYYLTGVEVPDCYLVHDMSSSRSTLFIAPLDPESVVWSGLPLSIEDAKEAYDVDEVKYSTELAKFLAGLDLAATDSGPVTLFTIEGQVSPQISTASNVETLFAKRQNASLLKTAIDVCRSIKDEYEVALIRRANHVTALAHLAVLKNVATAQNERELEAAFVGTCLAAGAPNQAYHSIVASGRSAATLHYVRNDQALPGKQLLLLDAACEWHCYAADVTRTFPIAGHWGKEALEIYNLVLEMQERCLKALKTGVVWDEVHELAHRVAVEGLLKLGILKGGSVDEILRARTSCVFLPHGLGHYLGMDTHDTGGNPNYKDPDPMFKYLRVRGKLPKGAVITVEPGVSWKTLMRASAGG